MNNHISSCRLGNSSDRFDNHVFHCRIKNNYTSEPFFKIYVFMEIKDERLLLSYESYLHKKGYDTMNWNSLLIYRFIKCCNVWLLNRTTQLINYITNTTLKYQKSRSAQTIRFYYNSKFLLQFYYLANVIDILEIHVR